MNTPSQWMTMKLQDAGIELLDCEHKTPQEQEDGYPYIMIPQIKNGRLDLSSVKYINENDFKLWTRKVLPKEYDVIVSRRCNPGESAVVPPNVDCALGQNLVLLRSHSTHILPQFLRWIARSPKWWESVNQFLNVGSIFDSLKCADIVNFEILVPPPKEQRAIAAVLSSLDDKIDLLHRQNATLEAMAEALFRQWFVVEAKEEWEEISVADVAEINSQSITKDYPYSVIEYLDTGSLTKGIFDKFQTIDIADAPSRAQRIVIHNDILISMVRPNQKHYGIIKNPNKNCIVSTGFCVVTCKQISPYFIYLFLTSDDMTEYLHSVAEGSTSAYPSLKPSDIANLTFMRPPHNLLEQFDKVANPMWDKITQNQQQIRTLEKLRDTLLPKLMSGEVRVDCADAG